MKIVSLTGIIAMALAAAAEVATASRVLQEQPTQPHKTGCGGVVNATAMLIFVGAVVAIGFLAFGVSILKVCKKNNTNTNKKQPTGFSTVHTISHSRNETSTTGTNSGVKVVKVVDSYPTKSIPTAAATRDVDTVSVADTDVSSDNGSDKV